MNTDMTRALEVGKYLAGHMQHFFLTTDHRPFARLDGGTDDKQKKPGRDQGQEKDQRQRHRVAAALLVKQDDGSSHKRNHPAKTERTETGYEGLGQHEDDAE